MCEYIAGFYIYACLYACIMCIYTCMFVHAIDDGDADWRPGITFVYFTVDFLICCILEGVGANLLRNTEALSYKTFHIHTLSHTCIGIGAFMQTKRT